MCAYFKRTAVGLTAILAVCLALSACKDSFIFDDEGVHEYTVPLMKDTNHFEVVLQSLNGSPIDKDKFTFTITDDNGYMAWDNSLLGDETLSYYAWNVDAGTADIQTRSQFSAVIAELTTARLVKGHNPRLTVSSNGKTVLSIPVIDIALLVKGKYNELMPDQEYLDRQDEYNFIFFLDDGERWMSSYIYINSWKVVLQNTGI